MCQNVIPVDVISLCSADGQMRPLRFRMEDTQHQLLRVDIDEVISSKDIQYAGIEAKIFLCRGYLAIKIIVALLLLDIVKC